MNNIGNKILEGRQTNKHKNAIQFNYYSKLAIDSLNIKGDTIFISASKNRTLIIKSFALNKSLKIMKIKWELANQIHFMHQSNQFVIFNEISIILWSYDNSYNWNKTKDIQMGDECRYISSLIISQNDDLIVNLEKRKKKIQFRRKQDDWQCYLELNFESNRRHKLILNEASNKLIALSYFSISLYTLYPEDKMNWVMTDKIKEKCISACFVSQNNLICFSVQEEHLTIYVIDQMQRLIKYKSLYFETKQITFSTRIYYLKQQNMILASQGKELIFIKQAFNDFYVVEKWPLRLDEKSQKYFLMALIQQGNFILQKIFDSRWEFKRIELRKIIQFHF